MFPDEAARRREWRGLVCWVWVLPARLLSGSQVSSVHCSFRASGTAAPASEHPTNGAASVGAAWQGSRAQRPPRQALTQIAGPSGSDPAGWGAPESRFCQGHSNAKASGLRFGNLRGCL